MIKQLIKADLEKVIAKLGLEISGEVDVVRTSDPKFGDFATNVGLKIRRDDNQSPVEIANKLADNLKSLPYVERLEVKGPGFVNFFIKDSFWQVEVENVLKKKKQDLRATDKKLIIEFTDPNPFKEFHIGHLYSNIVGESISRMWEAMGAEVKRACYQGDVGMHVAKTIWGIPKILEQTGETFNHQEKKPLSARVFFLGQAYSLGSKEFEASEDVKKEVAELNKKIFAMDEEIREIYLAGRKWSMDYFEEIYKRLGTKFDLFYLESEVSEVGAKIVRDFLKKGVFVKSQGAIVFPGEKYGLHSRVFINSLGLPTYEAKELGLAPTKYKDFAYDESVIITGNEINDYFKVLLMALSKINPDLATKTRHISHGMVRMPGGKMSSRLGNVLLGEWLLDEAKKRVGVQFKVTDDLAEIIGLGAIKYAFLKGNVGQDLNFTFEEAISLDGNSGPYVQYAHARCRSVLNKVKVDSQSGKSVDFDGALSEELKLLAFLGQFEDFVSDAALSFSPNMIAGYLFEVSQKFNTFYNNCSILKAEEKERTRRLFLTEATADILKKALWLLGISAPEKM